MPGWCRADAAWAAEDCAAESMKRGAKASVRSRSGRPITRQARAAEPGELHAVGVRRTAARGPAHAPHGVEEAVRRHGGAGDFQPRASGRRGRRCPGCRPSRPAAATPMPPATAGFVPMSALPPMASRSSSSPSGRCLSRRLAVTPQAMHAAPSAIMRAAMAISCRSPKAFGSQADVVDHHEQDRESSPRERRRPGNTRPPWGAGNSASPVLHRRALSMGPPGFDAAFSSPGRADAAPLFFGKVRRRCASVLLSMAQEGAAHDGTTAPIREWSDNAAARYGCPLPPIKQLVRPLLEVRRTDDSLICFQLDFWECIEETQFAAGEDGLQFFGGGDSRRVGQCCVHGAQPA